MSVRDAVAACTAEADVPLAAEHLAKALDGCDGSLAAFFYHSRLGLDADGDGWSLRKATRGLRRVVKRIARDEQMRPSAHAFAERCNTTGIVRASLERLNEEKSVLM